jgi:HK97 gp10 family phage protein
MIAVEAQISLTTGAGSGGRHIPSAPGEAPNQQTGVLGGNIEAVQVAIDEVHVTSSAPYSAALEWGTSKMGERPFMRPALEKKRKEARQLIARAARSLSR